MDSHSILSTIVSSLYPQSKISDKEVTYSGATYPIDPKNKYLVTKGAPVRNIQYSLDDIEEAQNHALVPRETIKKDILDWIESDEYQYALFSENTGSGKTKSVIDVFESYEGKYIACFHTRENRDKFVNRCDADVRIAYSTSEILQSVVGDDRAENIQTYIDDFFEDKKSRLALESDSENTSSFDKVLSSLRADRFISKPELESIRKKIRHTKYLIKSKHKLAMTSMKFEFMATYSDPESDLTKVPVFFDEVHLDQISGCSGLVSVYMNSEWYVKKPNKDVDQKALQNYKICFVSAERTIGREMTNQGLNVKRIGKHSNIMSDGLEIVRVPSTSSDNRQELYDTLSGIYPDATIICNGVNSDYNFTNSRGRNTHRDSKEIIIIMSYPTATEVGRCMMACGVDEEQAISLVLSDSINQMVGRNQGLRNASGENKCLLVVTHKMKFDCEFVTPNIVNKGSWAHRTLSERLDLYFKDGIDVLYDFEDFEEKVYVWLMMQQEEGKDEVSLNSIKNRFDISNKKIGSMVAKFGLETTRKMKNGIRLKYVLLDNL